MTVPLFHVDAFTGNPAVVCLLPAWGADGWQKWPPGR
jgi:hypothetical protein